ncbi:hypothetical protein JCM19239_5741 [Vibrio variabilis]|uniref:Uncharacterized protein n=1 Tax=Vibrio variabilis TaxID=990271 RepID=A0ABQ0JNI4_9VIBR|nr:hypothetical protein JCM19239_5741 [Vibrio variabilis]
MVSPNASHLINIRINGEILSAQPFELFGNVNRIPTLKQYLTSLISVVQYPNAKKMLIGVANGFLL